MRFGAAFRFYSKSGGADRFFDISYGAVRYGSLLNGLTTWCGANPHGENHIIPCFHDGAPYEQTAQNRAFGRVSS